MNRSTVHGMALGGGGGTSTDTSCSSNGKGVSSHRRNPSLTSRRKAIRPKKLLSAIRDSGEGLNFAPSSPYTPDTAISAMSVATAGSLVRRSRACSRGPKSPQSASASFGPDSRRQSTEDTNIPGEVQWQSKSKRGLYSNLRASVSTRSLPAMQSVSAATADAGHHSPNRSSGFRDDYCPTASSSECTVGNAASQPLSASTRSFGFVRNNSLKEPARKPKRYSRSSNNTSAATTPATATPKSPVGTLTAKDLSQPQPSLSKQLSKPSVQAPQQSTSTAPAVSTTNTTAAVNATSPLLLSGASQYSDLEQFAEGESGNLYSAYSEKTNSKVAIKKIPTSKLERLKKLRSEVALMEGVSCPEIVAFYDGFKVGDNFWVVYEYMDICALADLLGEYPSLILPEPLIAYAAQRLLRALGYLHQKRILHCDVRSDNILINSKGEVKLADFSNSTRLASGGSIQRSSSGAVYWMAPEIPKGQGYSAKSDVWAAGVVIYEMVMGKPPYIEYPELKAVTLIRDNGLAPWESPPFTPSQQLRDFVAKACDVRIQERFTAPQLLDHPFLTSLVTDNCPKDLLNFVAELESMQDGEEEEEEEEEDEGDDKAMLGQGKE
ncbi:hypothetical protein EV182_002465 [Spiromyces aspiralis]|uniref:Uncharacterized protein n=1 Tax=Spiromyces aspiralis TaxID=68401 RepID=A0ACC1HXX6_9FUNG|nr:hypothetical protein EV182_002465 [Spiromyces aspiralis]